MKKTITVLLLLFSAVTATAQTWEHVGSPGFTNSSTSFTTVKVDPTGIPYLAYIDGSSQKARVMRFNGTSWEDVGAPGFSAGAVDYLTFNLDPSGNPYVAYQDATLDQKLTVMKFDGASWVSVGMPGFSDWVFMNSLAINSDGVPYVAYFNVSTFDINVMRYNGAAWENVGNSPPGRGDYFSLAFNAADMPYLAFQDFDESGNKTTVMKFNGNEWVAVGTPGGVS